MANRNFEVVSFEDWGSSLIAYIRVLDKQYRYELPVTQWAWKLLTKRWFTAKDLETVEQHAKSYGRVE